MSLLIPTLILTALYFLLSRWVKPALEKRWKEATTASKIKRAAGLAAIKTAASFTGLAALVFGVVLALFLILPLIAPLASNELLAGLHEASAWLDERTKGLRSLTAQIPFWLALAGLGYFIYRAWTRRLRADLEAAYQAEFERISGELADGTADELPPTPAMLECDAWLADLEAESKAFAGNLPGDRRAALAFERARLHQVRTVLDIDRRIELADKLTPDFKRASTPGRLIAPLLSKGAADTVRAAGKVTGRLGTALACILVIGVSAPALGAMATEPLELRLSDLRVTRNQDEAIASIQALASAPTPPPCPNCEDDDDDASAAAQSFIRDLAAPERWQGMLDAGPPPPEGPTSRRAARAGGPVEEIAIRHAIVREYAAAASASRGAGAAPLTAPSPVAADRPAARSFDTYVASHVAADGRQPRAVGRIASIFRSAAQTSPRIRGAIRAYAASWRQSRTMWSYAEAVLGEAISSAIEVAIPGRSEPAFLDSRAWKAGESASEKALGRYVQIRLNEALRAGSEGRSIASTMAEAGPLPRTAIFQRPDADALRPLLAQRERSPQDLGLDRPRLVAGPSPADAPIAERVQGQVTTPERLALIGQYEDMPVDRLAERVGRRTNVGGVVIGREPAAADYVQLGWSSAGPARFSLWLVDGRGSRTGLGDHSSSLILQALAYAADGRPLATTIMGSVKRVQLHPAIVDTALGCDVIAVDNFVYDDSRNSPRRVWRERLELQLSLYNWLWDRNPPRFNARFAGYYRSAFPQDWQPSDPRQSIFAHHGNAFDQPAVASLSACRGAGGDQDIVSCLNDLPVPGGGRWTHNQVSGVRETGTGIDPASLAWLRGEDVAGTGPFHFLEQIVFEGEAECAYQSSCGTFNRSAWTFPMFGDEVQRGVERYVAENPAARAALDNVIRFTLLQRIFRAAIAGRFSERFDRGTLVRLAQAMRADGPVAWSSTPRYDLTQGEARQLMARQGTTPAQREVLSTALASQTPLFAGAGTCRR